MSYLSRARAASVVMTAVVASFAALAVPASATPAALTPRVHYAVNRPLCAAASSPAAYTCAALRRVQVTKGTPGAYAYTQPSYAHGPAGGLTPADLAKAYGYNPNLHRQGQTVALVNWYDDPNARADLDSFDRHYHLPVENPYTFRQVNQSGRTTDLPRSNRDSAGETSLDIETVRAVCHTCHILLVEAKGPDDSDLAAAENTAARLGATEISNSFGSVEHHVSSRIRAAFDHPGIVITASTGDDGWYGWDSVNDGVKSPGRASYPATDPHVVAVGGTTLNLTSSGTRASETVWNGNAADDSRGLERGSQGASGGGCSKIYGPGAWQRKHVGYAAATCGGKRLAADVSADANPATGLDVINTFHQKGYTNWGTVGGTSLSSPLVTAMFALVGGAHGSAYPAASLYLNATHRSYAVNDVTKGGNSFCGGDTTSRCSAELASVSKPRTNNPNGFGGGITDCSYPRNANKVSSAPAKRSECNASAGYDGASGVGTPKGLAFFHATNPHVSITHPAHAHVGHSGFFTAKALEQVAGLKPTGYSWTFGDGGSSSRTKPGTHHTYKTKGSYRVELRVTDNSGQITVKHFYEKVT